jgi:DNA polymerase V
MKAIVDCNSFYASCERLFEPSLRNRPVVVLSNNDGCIIARSDEAKALGVEMAGPYFLARKVIEDHNVTVFSSNYHLYGDISRRVMKTLRHLAPDIEVYSVDEAFIDLDGMAGEKLFDFGRNIVETVQQWTGIPVSVGIAPTKVLAKVANRLVKKNKISSNSVWVLNNDDDRRAALKATRVTQLWGIGRAYSEKLLGWGITNGWELSQFSEEWARKNLGGVTGVRFIKELNGIPCNELQDQLETKEMIASTRSFGKPVTTLTQLKEAVATYTSMAAVKLRMQHSAAGIISVFAKTDRFKDLTPRGTGKAYKILSSPTALTHELIGHANGLAEEIFQRGIEYKNAGVILSGLVPENAIQTNLFEPAVNNNQRRLMNVMDHINYFMGDAKVKFVSTGLQNDWKMRSEMRSGRYTTQWGEIKEVK